MLPILQSPKPLLSLLQVLTTGKRLWAKNSEADLFEIFVLNEKLELKAQPKARSWGFRSNI
jgi:hypothetical protein